MPPTPSPTQSAPPAPGRILKAHDLRGLGSKIVFDFEDLRARGAQEVDASRTEATRLLDEARRQVDAVREQARKEGRAAGLAEGAQEAARRADETARKRADELAAQRLKTVLPAVESIARALADERDRWLAEWETLGTRLALAVARRLVRGAFDADPTRVADTVRAALDCAAGQPQVAVHLHPDDVARLGADEAALRAALGTAGDVSFVPDATIEPGGCLLRTRHGTVDARIDAQLARIAEELLGAADD